MSMDVAWIGDVIEDWSPPQPKKRRCAGCTTILRSSKPLTEEYCDVCARRIENPRPVQVVSTRTNATGYAGVVMHNNRYAAQVCHRGVKRHLGMFATAEQAHARYVEELKVIQKEK